MSTIPGASSASLASSPSSEGSHMGELLQAVQKSVSSRCHSLKVWPGSSAATLEMEVWEQEQEELRRRLDKRSN